MKNTIKNNRANEVKAEEEARKAAERQAELDAIEPKDIVATMDEVADGTAHAYRDEDGNAKGTNGGDYIQVPVGGGKTIAAKTQEEIDAIKDRMTRGIEGDGLLHKILVIGGMRCDCVGATEEELAEDIKKAENYAKAHGLNVLRDIDIAEQLVDAEYQKEDLEQIEVKGIVYLISYSEKRVMRLDGTTVVDLDNISSTLSKEDIKTILMDRM